MHTLFINKMRASLGVCLLSFLLVGNAFAGFFGMQEVEKPTPEFTRDGDVITAKLIPRAKSTSVQILFKVENGNLIGVTGMDFFEAARPEVDVKNFKSSLFVIAIDGVSPGETAKVSIVSQFFISSTQFYIFNETQTPAWFFAGSKNISLPDRVQELVVEVKDGGPFDSDGKANGKIKFIGGPRDSFWGYAMGTLFIRFFGIFLVLTVLMIGMILSGRIFQRMEKKSSSSDNSQNELSPPKKAVTPVVPAPLKENALTAETAAAIAVALQLFVSDKKQNISVLNVTQGISSSWTQSGRTQIMNERLMMMYNH